MQITYLDVKATHDDPFESSEPCPANRYVPQPNGGWMCLDCGRQVILGSIEVTPTPSRVKRLTEALKRTGQ
ncbi:MAG: hypothetical protein A2Y38_19495 [Spirochaetes bacterium GWB1_59_5]|nr:MAG: hypothetical protein A2Y38_19495 [Spirochaetes bacterium GWB1_59_5]